MITEKYLDEIESRLKHFERITLEDAPEIIRLARLGLKYEEYCDEVGDGGFFKEWAEKEVRLKLGLAPNDPIPPNTQISFTCSQPKEELQK